jgi:hypothetical protein
VQAHQIGDVHVVFDDQDSLGCVHGAVRGQCEDCVA